MSKAFISKAFAGIVSAVLVLCALPLTANAETAIPPMPDGNYNYASGMYPDQLTTGGTGSYENGVLKMDTDSDQKLIPFGVQLSGSDSFIYQATVKQNTGSESWHGARFIFSLSSDFVHRTTVALFPNLAIFIEKGSAMGVSGQTDCECARENGTEYKMTVWYNAGSFSVWIDDKLVMEDVKAQTVPQKIFLGLEVAVADVEVSDFLIYKTTDDTEAAHQGGTVLDGGNEQTGASLPKQEKIPVPPEGNTDKMSLEHSMSCTNGNLQASYINGVFSNTGDTHDGVVRFESFTDIKYSDTYLLKYKVKINNAVPNEAYGDYESPGPRIIFRGESDSTYLSLAFCKSNLWIFGCYNGIQSVDATVPFNRQFGKTYDVVIYSEPTSVKIWVDGVMYFNQGDLPSYSPMFGAQLYRTATEITDIEVYNMAEDTAENETEIKEAVEAGNTLNDSQSKNASIKSRYQGKIILFSAVAAVAAVAIISFTVFILLKGRKKRPSGAEDSKAGASEQQSENK